MKKFLLLAAMIGAFMGFTSCNDEDEDPITLSLASTAYTIANEDGASVTITATTSAPVQSAVEVPFTVTGGTEGSDFTLSAQKFSFAAGASSSSVTITRAGATAQLTLTLTLGQASGLTLGAVNYATITVVGSNIYSFADSNDKLSLDKSYAIELETASGEAFKFATETSIDVEVVAESTTAVEGTHFEFVGDKKAVFEAGSSKGYVTLRYLALEEGKDKIVLKVADSAKLYAGNNPTLTIKIVGPSDFSGTWAYEKITNESWLLSDMGFPALSTIVDGTAESDTFTLSGDDGNYTFTPNFAGKLKNYFTAKGSATYSGVKSERLQEEGGLNPPKIDLSVLSIENINLNMSATDKTIGKYDVGFYLTRNEDGAERLWMTIYQYRPTENTVKGDWDMTFSDIVDMMDWGSTDTVNSMSTAPIRIYFTRVQ